MAQSHTVLIQRANMVLPQYVQAVPIQRANMVQPQYTQYRYKGLTWYDTGTNISTVHNTVYVYNLKTID